MKTRAIARTLRMLADWLEHLPDQELASLSVASPDERTQAASLAVNVSTLAGLSRINKTAWIDFIRQHGFPIDVRPRDASRDILGKLLKFLEEEPAALEYLQRRVHREVGTPPELTRALRALLDYRG